MAAFGIEVHLGFHTVLLQSQVVEQSTLNADAVVFANPASTTRDTLTLRLGSPDAATWTVGRVLEAGRAAYCDLAVVPDRSVGDAVVLCLYETGEATPYETLRLARVPIGWL